VKTESEYLADIGNMRHAYKGAVVLDIEGNTKDVRADPESRTLGLSYSYRLDSSDGPKTSGYLPFHHAYGNLPISFLDILRDILQRYRLHTIYHNAKYDLVGLKNNLGIDLLGTEFYCTLLMGHFVNENMIDKSLDAMSRRYGGKPKNKTEAFSKIAKAFGYEFIPTDMMSEYSTNDSEITDDLFWKLLPDFNSQGFQELWEVERDWIRFLIQIEAAGISIDEELCESEIKVGTEEMEKVSEEIGGNPASPKFLEQLLTSLGIPVKKTAKGNPSFNKEAMKEYEIALEAQQNPLAQLVLKFRGWQKTVSTNYKAYLRLLSPDRRLRPNYKIHGTVTSRLSCEDPNLQNIPRISLHRWNGRLKKAFIARRGYTLWEFDYSNLELRIAAVYSGDETLLTTFLLGLKPFDVMAQKLGWPRHDCKTFTYTVLYGGGNDRVATVFRTGISRAKQMRAEFFAAYPGLQRFSREAANRAETRGYVKLWTGRKRHFEWPESEGYKAMNSIFQGGGAEIVKRKGIEIGKAIDWDECKVLLQVHDSYVFEIKDGTESHWHPIIQDIMESVGDLSPFFRKIPFPVGIKKWGEE
jgi:DNA polymerase-1